MATKAKRSVTSTQSKYGSTVSVKVHCQITNEDIALSDVDVKTELSEIKEDLELLTGIPSDIQRISYLDGGDLDDKSCLFDHHIVNNAQLQLNIWYEWTNLIKAVSKGDINQVMQLGVTDASEFNTANSRMMAPEARSRWLRRRGFVAMLVASHHGNKHLIGKLLQEGVTINGKTKKGRNVLHIAATSGKSEAIQLLIQHGAQSLIDEKDNDGLTSIDCAEEQNATSKMLYLFRWNMRNKAKKLKKLTKKDLMAHQVHDSTLGTSLHGKYKQHYQCNILPVQEFRGTSISSKKSEIYQRNR